MSPLPLPPPFLCWGSPRYQFAPTYSSVLVFPNRTTDAELRAVGAFRSKARVPTFTWMHPVHKTTLWRSSQPRVGISGNTCTADERLLANIREATNPLVPLIIVDCRPKANAVVGDGPVLALGAPTVAGGAGRPCALCVF
jgi:hypothetical protein